MKGQNTKHILNQLFLFMYTFFINTVLYCISCLKSVLIWKGYYNNIKTGSIGVAGRPVGAGGDGDGLGGTGIPIIGAKPGILVIYATNSKINK